MWLTCSSLEYDLEDNYVLYIDSVVGSIDPNDKKATPAGEGINKAVTASQRLTYLIQFENLPAATADAIYVRVVDTLDPDLDWGTLSVGTMSHPDKCDWDFDPYTGVIEWFCDSIMLPPNHTPPEGEGYFMYSISPKKNLEPGVELTNTAWIRFDYNSWLMAPEFGPVVRTIKSPSCCIDYTGNADCSDEEEPDISDITRLIDYLYISHAPLCCLEEADADASGGEPDISDITRLIDYLYLSHEPLAECP